MRIVWRFIDETAFNFHRRRNRRTRGSRGRRFRWLWLRWLGRPRDIRRKRKTQKVQKQEQPESLHSRHKMHFFKEKVLFSTCFEMTTFVFDEVHLFLTFFHVVVLVVFDIAKLWKSFKICLKGILYEDLKKVLKWKITFESIWIIVNECNQF